MASSTSNTNTTVRDGLHFLPGFGNEFESECVPGSLPKHRNTPRLVPLNLYSEQLSGSAFTAPRSQNRRTWLYRIQPSVANGFDVDIDLSKGVDTRKTMYFGGVNPNELETTPKPLRWKPLPPSGNEEINFVTGMQLLAGAGSPLTKSGLGVYMYTFQDDMSATSSHLMNADGDFLIVPQQGSLAITTEVGRMIVHPNDICVIPRGIVFSVDLHHKDETKPEFARGYVLEIYQGHFQLPELGPIGANGLANARDFLHPTAWCVSNREEYNSPGVLWRKFGSQLFQKSITHSPYNVVAWYGNYLPFVYDLHHFCAVNSVTYDHLDPSIYTVLTCPSHDVGTAIADFVIFPPRIMATDSNTLRPPYFHRNCMTEFMGLISGNYDAKEGFQPGGASLHSCMTPHGPDAISYNKAVMDECAEPTKFDGGLAFMFETCLMLQLSPSALTANHLDVEYEQCWQPLTADLFTGWDLLKPPSTDTDKPGDA